MNKYLISLYPNTAQKSWMTSQGFALDIIISDIAVRYRTRYWRKSLILGTRRGSKLHIVSMHRSKTKWILTISVILVPRYACLTGPYYRFWTNSSCTILDWFTRLDEHDSRRPEPGIGEPAYSFLRTNSTRKIVSRGHTGNRRHVTHKRQYPNIAFINYIKNP